MTKAVREALVEWRTKEAPSRLANFMFTDPLIIMPNSVAILISRVAESITDLSSLSELVKQQWAFFELLGSEVLKVIRLAKMKVETLRR